MDEFPKQPLKKFNNNFDKISLLFETVFNSEARSVLPTVQLDFSWTLKMFDGQNNWFPRTSEGLSISQSDILHNSEALSKLSGNSFMKIFLKVTKI